VQLSQHHGTYPACPSRAIRQGDTCIMTHESDCLAMEKPSKHRRRLSFGDLSDYYTLGLRELMNMARTKPCAGVALTSPPTESWAITRNSNCQHGRYQGDFHPSF
jgi:hypothetical protein